MEPQKTIDDLTQVLGEMYAEDMLHTLLETRLSILRVLYRSNKEVFSNEHILFLQKVGQIDTAIVAFIRLREELEEVLNVEDYHRLMAELAQIRETLSGTAVIQRVEKEIRSLREKLPKLEEQVRIAQQIRLQSRRRQVERNAPVCPDGHAMVIRESTRGYFWGCTWFPNCAHTKRLSRDEEKMLAPE